MANTWIKLYHEILTDPKMYRMSDHLFRRTIELFLIAGQNSKWGVLPEISVIAWILHEKEKNILKVLTDLTSLGIVCKTDGGQYVIRRFYERQYTSESVRNSCEYANWRKSVFERDDYTCACCGQRGGKLNAHHIKYFAYYPEDRLNVSNGITLCEECHKKVHRHEIKLVIDGD